MHLERDSVLSRANCRRSVLCGCWPREAREGQLSDERNQSSSRHSLHSPAAERVHTFIGCRKATLMSGESLVPTVAVLHRVNNAMQRRRSEVSGGRGGEEYGDVRETDAILSGASGDLNG